MQPESHTYSSEERALFDEIKWVGRLALRLVQDANRVDDACQEAWLRLRDAGKPLPKRNEILRTIRRILSRERRAELRRNRREAGREQPASVEAMDVLLVRREQLQRVWNGVLALPEPLRSTLLLHFQEGLTPQAIAERHGCAADTVRWRLRSGVSRLRASLGEDREGGGLAGLLLAVPLSFGGIDGRALLASAPVTSIPWIGGLLMMKAYIAAGAAVLLACWIAWPSTRALEEDGAALRPEYASAPSPAGDGAIPAPLVSLPSERSTVSQSLALDPISLPTQFQAAPREVVLRVHLECEDFSPLPESVDVSVISRAGTDTALYEKAPVRDGVVELGPSAFYPYHLAATECSLEVRAAGWAPGILSSFVTTPGVTQELRVPMHVVREVPVRLVDAVTGVALASPRCEVFGPGAALGGWSPDVDHERVMRVRVAPSLDEDDWLLFTATGYAPAPCRLLDLLATPLSSGGIRDVPMHRGATLTGSIERDDGMPLEGEHRLEARFFPEFAALPGSPIPASLPARRPIAVRPDGTFQIDGIPLGELHLNLFRLGEQNLQQPVLETVKTSILSAEPQNLRIAVPVDLVAVTVDIDWRREATEEGAQYVQWLELYRLDSESDGPYSASPGPRRQIWKTAAVQGQPTRLPLPKELIDANARLLLCIGPDPVLRVERWVEFSGPAPKLQHRFSLDATDDLWNPGSAGEPDAQGDRAADERRQRALIVLRAD